MTTTPLRLAAATLFLASATLLQAAIAPAENLLPADTLAFFTVPDCAAVRANAKTSPQMMFWNDPAMKAFHDKFMAKFNEQFITPLEKDLGLKVDDFLALPQGQFTLAVTLNGANGHDDVPPGLILLLDAKGQSGLLKTNLDGLMKKWTAAGRALRTEKINGLTFTVVPLTSNDFSGILPKRPPVSEIGVEPKPEKPGEIYFTQFESLLVAGNSPKAVDAVAAHLTGGRAPAIADDAAFAADQPALFRNAPLYYGWFNGNKVFTLMAQAPEAAPEAAASSLLPGFSSAKIVSALGLAGLKSASFALRETHDGATLTLQATAPAAERQGLLKLLAMAPKDASAPAFVPAGVTKFTRMRLDGKQAWADLQKMLAGISPQVLASVNAVIDIANSFAQQKNPGFDLRTSLFANLGDDIITYQKAPASDTLEAMNQPPSLILLAVANPDQAIVAIKTVAALTSPGTPTEPRTFLGRKIHTVALKGTRDATTGTTSPVNLYIAASGGYLAMSPEVAMVEEFLRSADGKVKPLSETAGLATAIQNVGGTGGGVFGYQNAREIMRTSFKLLSNPAFTDRTLNLLPPAFRGWADFTLLPEFDPVAKYFYLTVFGANANAEGMTLKIFSPRPPQLN